MKRIAYLPLLIGSAMGANIDELLNRPSEGKSKSYMPHQGKKEIERRRKRLMRELLTKR